MLSYSLQVVGGVRERVRSRTYEKVEKRTWPSSAVFESWGRGLVHPAIMVQLAVYDRVVDEIHANSRRWRNMGMGRRPITAWGHINA
jgi:hypothetical protein